MEAVSTSETSVSFYQSARRNIPEESHLHLDNTLLQSVDCRNYFKPEVDSGDVVGLRVDNKITLLGRLVLGSASKCYEGRI
jgi:hypothetical protein